MPGMGGDMMGGGGGQPPLPPSASPAGGSSGPTFAGLAGNQPPQGGQQPVTPGASQTSGALVRLAMEIDQALKLLAQAAPQLSAWVDQTTQQLRAQVGVAISSGVPSSSQPNGVGNFPGGGTNLT